MEMRDSVSHGVFREVGLSVLPFAACAAFLDPLGAIMKSNQNVIAVSALVFAGMVSLAFAGTPRADLRGQLDRYRSAGTQRTSQRVLQSTSGAQQSVQRRLNPRPVTQVDLLRQQLLLQQQQRGLRQQVTLVPDGRGGVIAIPVVNPLAPIGVTVGAGSPGVGNTGVQQQPTQRVNRIRVGN